MVRVLVADRAPIFRRGLIEALTGVAGIAVVGEVGDASSACSAVLHQSTAGDPVDVVLVDLQLPAQGGAAACRSLRDCEPAPHVLVLADGAEDPGLADAVRAGARGYLSRSCSVEELREAILAVSAGESLLSPALVSQLLDELVSLSARRERQSAGAIALSHREREVLSLVAEGLNNRSIAERLYISENTVKNHVRNIHEKLGVHSRIEAVIRAVREGVLQIA